MTSRTTTAAENRELVRTFHSDIWAGDLDLFEEHVADDYVGHDPGVPDGLHGPDEFREFIGGLQAALSDIDHTIEDLVAEDDRVVVRGRLTARHTGELMGVPATDREVTVGETIVYRIEDGQIAESWAAVDHLGLLTQLGAVEPPQA